MKIKTLKDSTPRILKFDESLDRDESFLADLEETMIKPLQNLGVKFLGYGAMENRGKSKGDEQAGVHILIFDYSKLDHLPEVPLYSDEGTTSTHYFYYGTLYIFIPIPY